MTLNFERRMKELIITLRIPWKRRRRHVSAETRQRMSEAQKQRHARGRADKALADGPEGTEVLR